MMNGGDGAEDGSWALDGWRGRRFYDAVGRCFVTLFSCQRAH